MGALNTTPSNPERAPQQPSSPSYEELLDRDSRWRALFARATTGLALFRVRADGNEPGLEIEEINAGFRLLAEVPGEASLSEAICLIKLSADWKALVRQAALIDTPLTIDLAVSADERLFTLRAVRYAPDRVSLSLIDVTERRQLAERVQAAQRLESIGLLVSGITHDLNNSLAPGLMGATVLKRRHGHSPDDLKLITYLEDSAKAASEMVRHIMSSVRDSKSSAACLYPAQALKDIVKVLRVTLPTSIRIEVDYGKHLPPASLDPSHFNQVMLNLAINARDAMPEGGTLSLRVAEIVTSAGHPVEVPRAGRYVLFSIIDSGSGIPPDHLKKIFEPFFTTKEAGKGTGLGLPRVKEMIEKRGGVVGLSSTVGQGTEFRLYVPALVGEAAEGVPEEIEEEAAPEGDMQRILIVDDYAGLRETLALLLKTNGFDPLVAADGHEALKMLRQLDEKPDLLLVDLTMPRTNGEELVGHMRDANDHTPVIVMTAHGPGEDFHATEARLKALGVSSILRKPLREPVLLKAIHAALSAG